MKISPLPCHTNAQSATLKYKWTVKDQWKNSSNEKFSDQNRQKKGLGGNKDKAEKSKKKKNPPETKTKT